MGPSFAEVSVLPFRLPHTVLRTSFSHLLHCPNFQLAVPSPRRTVSSLSPMFRADRALRWLGPLRDESQSQASAAVCGSGRFPASGSPEWNAGRRDVFLVRASHDE